MGCVGGVGCVCLLSFLVGGRGVGAVVFFLLWLWWVWLLVLLVVGRGYGAYVFCDVWGGSDCLHCWWVVGAMVPMFL